MTDCRCRRIAGTRTDRLYTGQLTTAASNEGMHSRVRCPGKRGSDSSLNCALLGGVSVDRHAPDVAGGCGGQGRRRCQQCVCVGIRTTDWTETIATPETDAVSRHNWAPGAMFEGEALGLLLAGSLATVNAVQISETIVLSRLRSTTMPTFKATSFWRLPNYSTYPQ